MTARKQRNEEAREATARKLTARSSDDSLRPMRARIGRELTKLKGKGSPNLLQGWKSGLAFTGRVSETTSRSLRRTLPRLGGFGQVSAAQV